MQEKKIICFDYPYSVDEKFISAAERSNPAIRYMIDDNASYVSPYYEKSRKEKIEYGLDRDILTISQINYLENPELTSAIRHSPYLFDDDEYHEQFYGELMVWFFTVGLDIGSVAREIQTSLAYEDTANSGAGNGCGVYMVAISLRQAYEKLMSWALRYDKEYLELDEKRDDEPTESRAWRMIKFASTLAESCLLDDIDVYQQDVQWYTITGDCRHDENVLCVNKKIGAAVEIIYGS